MQDVTRETQYATRNHSQTGQAEDEIAMLGLMKRGVDIIHLTPKEIVEGRKAMKPAWERGVGRAYPRELLDNIIQDLAAYRSTKSKVDGR